MIYRCFNVRFLVFVTQIMRYVNFYEIIFWENIYLYLVNIKSDQCIVFFHYFRRNRDLYCFYNCGWEG